ncbi:hypothetical protein EZV62_002195 [Acer yangbiense]|uniref:Integrase catalytic domain-containing protein n=1 Tax=Acer yangbiense TaxID=1000413 RepID=A0A5C7IYU0_9ROSI|nr:hypothetical protein EZV62_002195 [Acer yangbiense]
MGAEFQSFIPFLRHSGITPRFSCAYSHQQNGIPERKHRHVVETGLILLAHAGMPLKFWCEAFSTATILINNLPTILLHSKSPYEVLYLKKPNYSFLKTFGCACFPYLRDTNKHKLDFHTSICLFLGYSLLHHGYKCLSSSGRIFISRNVLFHELEFPYHSLFSKPVSPVTSSPFLPLSVFQSLPNLSPSSTPSRHQLSPTFSAQNDSSNSGSHTDHSFSSPHPISTDNSPSLLALPTNPINSHPMQTRAKSGIYKPKAPQHLPQPLIAESPYETISVFRILSSLRFHQYDAMQWDVSD